MLLSFIIVTLKISVLSALIYIGSYFALKRSDMKIGLYLSLASFIQFALTFGWVYLSMPMLNTSFNYIYGNLMASVIAGIVVYFVSLAAPMQRPHTHRERTFLVYSSRFAYFSCNITHYDESCRNWSN